MSDFVWALWFLLFYEVLSMPLRMALSRRGYDPDLVRAISRVGGPALLCLAPWALSYGLPGMLSPVTTWLWIGAALALGWRAMRREGGELSLAILRPGLLEIVTVVLYFGFVAFKRHVPEMTTFTLDGMAAEKFGNAMIFWSNWYATSRPPDDFWMAGEPLRYYDGGHFHWAWAGRAAGLPAEIALNIGFARAVTLVWEASYLLARTIGLIASWSAVAGVMATWGGNLDPLPKLLALGDAPSLRAWVSSFDVWGPSRAISDLVVDEFPAFSSILGDFHSHHLALPWFVAWLALLILQLEPPPKGEKSDANHTPWTPLLDITMIACGVLTVITNMWNLPALAVLCAVALGIELWRRRFPVRLFVVSTLLGLVALAGVLAIRGVGDDLMPGKSLDGGNGGLIGLLPRNLQSSWAGFVGMWGWPILALAAGGIAWLVARDTVASRRILALVGAGVLAAAATASWWPLGFTWAPLAVLGATMALESDRSHVPRAVIPVLAGSWIVLALLEVFYIDDAMGGEHERYNTYFKYCYLVWPALQVASTAWLAAAWNVSTGRVTQVTLRGLVVLILAVGMLYTAAGLPARAMQNSFAHDATWTPTLDAYDFLAHRRQFPHDAFEYAVELPALQWIRREVPPGDAVLEGVWIKEWSTPAEYTSTSYDFHGRVASLGGRAVPLGWGLHERTWRGNAGHRLVDAREDLIDAVYMAPDAAAMRSALDALRVHGVGWVHYGLLEQRRYGEHKQRGDAVRTLLDQVGTCVFKTPAENPRVFVYDVRPSSDRASYPGSP